ncbi:hypothetical protein DPMN_058705 [Dreissena polymorpha]|uniref:Uncharacterized protein n=1 Tax=Dreissena polymorpha TaxID=45954 RepID=A0A9D4C2J2_DREPO|nr:hypothetical protein DPMN_058705 [Dreissena polymorpha]
MTDVTPSTKNTSTKETTSGTTTTTSGNTSVKRHRRSRLRQRRLLVSRRRTSLCPTLILQSKALSNIKQQQLDTDAKFTELVTRVSALEEMPVDYGYEEFMEEGELAEGFFKL